MTVILITLAATMAIQTGYFLWKICADELPIIGQDSNTKVIKGFLTSGKWLLGTLATTIGWVLFVKATDLGEVSIVQPLMSVGDLYLILLAVIFLKEKMVSIEWLGLALTVIGACTLGVDAKIVEPAGINWHRFLIFTLCAVAALIASLVFAKRSSRIEVPMAIAVGVGFGMGAVLTELMTAYLSVNNLHLESWDGILNPILPFMIGANVIGLVLLQAAFQRGRAAVIVPVQLSVVNGMVVLAGVLVFSEIITPLRLVGIALIVIGTALLQLVPRDH